MKVFLKCIYENNLGDDLFIKTICERYPNTSFISLTTHKTKKIDIKNLKVYYINDFIYRATRKISFFFNRNCIFDELIIRHCDIVVSIGGSIFMEDKSTVGRDNREKMFNTSWYKRLRNKKIYILGANIGPVYTEQYTRTVEDVINLSSDTCLRDNESQKIVSRTKARIAPDIIFGTLKKYSSISKKKQAVISLINCEKKQNQMRNFNRRSYDKAIDNLIIALSKKGYSITLFSFCENEADGTIAETLKSKYDSKIKLQTYHYENNIDQALKLLASADYIIGSRFHANIIGFALGSKVIPIIYNDKTRNLLNDISFKGYYIDIENETYPDIDKLLNNKPLPTAQIEQFKKESEHHFDALDKILK